MGKPKNKTERIAEAILLGSFVIVSSISSLYLLDFINITEQTQVLTGYTIGGFAVLVFGYVTWKSVDK